MNTIFRKKPLLPSLLDRLTDDSYVNHNIERCKQRIKTLEKQLSTFSHKEKQRLSLSETEKKQQKQCQKELRKEYQNKKKLDQSTASLDKIKDCVKRDLTWLLNSQNMCMDKYLEKNYPNVASSVINFGMPDMTGRTVSSLDAGELEHYIKNAITYFEPRLIPSTVKIKLLTEKSMLDHNALVFQIDADLWVDPEPLHLQLQTQVDLENGYVDVKEE